MRCFECGEPVTVHRRTIDVSDTVGIPNVRLEDAEVSICRNGHETVKLPDLKQFNLRLAALMLQKPTALNGNELRFLRKVCAFRAVDLAALLGVTPEHVSRWETGKSPVSELSDRLARCVFHAALRDATSWQRIDVLNVLKSISNSFAENSGYALKAAVLEEGRREVRWDGQHVVAPAARPTLEVCSFDFFVGPAVVKGWPQPLIPDPEVDEAESDFELDELVH